MKGFEKYIEGYEKDERSNVSKYQSLMDSLFYNTNLENNFNIITESETDFDFYGNDRYWINDVNIHDIKEVRKMKYINIYNYTGTEIVVVHNDFHYRVSQERCGCFNQEVIVEVVYEVLVNVNKRNKKIVFDQMLCDLKKTYKIPYDKVENIAIIPTIGMVIATSSKYEILAPSVQKALQNIYIFMAAYLFCKSINIQRLVFPVVFLSVGSISKINKNLKIVINGLISDLPVLQLEEKEDDVKLVIINPNMIKGLNDVSEEIHKVRSAVKIIENEELKNIVMGKNSNESIFRYDIDYRGNKCAIFISANDEALKKYIKMSSVKDIGYEEELERKLSVTEAMLKEKQEEFEEKIKRLEEQHKHEKQQLQEEKEKLEREIKSLNEHIKILEGIVKSKLNLNFEELKHQASKERLEKHLEIEEKKVEKESYKTKKEQLSLTREFITKGLPLIVSVAMVLYYLSTRNGIIGAKNLAGGVVMGALDKVNEIIDGTVEITQDIIKTTTEKTIETAKDTASSIKNKISDIMYQVFGIIWL